MTPEQTQELAALKAALKQHIEEAEKVPSKKWKTSFRPKGLFIQNANPHDVGVPNDVCRIYNCSCSNEFATFMVQARTMSPAACKCLLLAIEGLEKIAFIKEDAGQPDHSFTGRTAASALKSIRQEWHNLTQK